MRENTAPSRQHASRLAANKPDLSLTATANETTGGSEEDVAKSFPVMVDRPQPANKDARSTDFEALLDVSEAAALLRIHPKTLQRLARFAHVPAYRVGRFWRYRASDLEMWLRSGANSKRQPADGVDFTEEKTQ
jgi:excisionase family DNA binding protein